MDTSVDLNAEQIDETRRRAQAFGDKLRGLRVENRLTQQQLADLTGLNKKTIQRFENGERPMDYDQLWALAEALSTTPSEFVRSVEVKLGRYKIREVGPEIVGEVEAE